MVWLFTIFIDQALSGVHHREELLIDDVVSQNCQETKETRSSSDYIWIFFDTSFLNWVSSFFPLSFSNVTVDMGWRDRLSHILQTGAYYT